MDIRFKLQGDGRKSWVIDEKELIYESPVNKIHNEKLEAILKKHNYTSLSEVLVWLGDAEYGEEALSILEWYRKTTRDIEAYTKLKPNEETASEFIDSLIKFEIVKNKKK